MKGLLVKDWHILWLQSRILLLALGVSAILILTMENPSFLIGYVTMICSIQVLSTISYDDYDNGAGFIFTLPITRKEYVYEKYMLAGMVGGVAGLVSTVASIAVSTVRIEQYRIIDGVAEAVVIMGVCLSLLFMMIPIQIKYGSEKARVIQFAIAGIVMVVVYLMSMLTDKMEAMGIMDQNKFLEAVSSVGNAEMVTGIVLLMGIIVIGTMCISVKVMEKKEF